MIHSAIPLSVAELDQRAIYYRAVCNWAGTVPETQWTPGCPPVGSGVAVVIGATGRMLAVPDGEFFLGRLAAKPEFYARYGAPVRYLLPGD